MTTKLKTRNIRIIKNLIKRRADRFDMSTWGGCNFHECGTIGCIAGFCRAYLNEKKFKYYNLHDFSDDLGGQLLGLDERQINSLFLGGNIWVKYANELGLEIDCPYGIDQVFMDDITSKMAVTMLENLASGKWSF